MNKGFTEQEVGAFFRAIDSPKFHLLFSYQAQLGLRIGEAIRISLKDIRFESRELVVKTEKAMILDTLLIPAPLFQETLAYIQANGREIEKASGFLFFKEYGKSRTIESHLARGMSETSSGGLPRRLGWTRSTTRARSLGRTTGRRPRSMRLCSPC